MKARLRKAVDGFEADTIADVIYINYKSYDESNSRVTCSVGEKVFIMSYLDVELLHELSWQVIQDADKAICKILEGKDESAS